MESLPSSPASTVPSVLESNEVEERQSRNDGNSNASYGEEQFESESEHSASDILNSSSSENYESDEFEVDEHDQEAVGTIEREALGGGVDDDQVYSEDNEYADESFEDEREDVTGFDNQTETHDVEQQQDAENQELDIDEVVQLMPTVGQDLDPHVGTWCSKKIRELRVASSQSETRRSRRRNTRSNVDRIPTAVVENLIHRANNARPSGRAHEKPGNSWLRYHQQLKVPASLMQRVQTQLWMAKTSYTESTKESTPESLSTSLRSVAATFCSVKRDDLLGQLATMKLSKSAEKWAAPDSGGLSLGTLEFVHNMTAKQREICAANAWTDDSEGRMLHRVTMATRLQLEDSIALRNQTQAVLGRLPTKLS
ncbi:hypothetical protein F444_19810 [Phytophthora nicotianae P1976]|uniref:Uncharacterized protein n=1 Tax=Phytophthora nicotianae P1976 TaxID=1317066 RepID=A0A080Z6I1_PHYNI|nr:hypothetical protein F444_19810 [Phytophthora nicotianae P1976]